MKLTLAAISAAFVLFSANAAAQDGAENTSPYTLKMFDIPLIAPVVPQNYRSAWSRLSGFEYSGLHWDQFIILYSNIGYDNYKENYLEYVTWFEDPDDDENLPEYKAYPEGTVMLKENFSKNNGRPDAPISITAMIKRAAGYDSSNGDWEYLEFDPNGSVLLQGKANDPEVAQRCASCHQSVANRDYIFSHVFSALK